MWPSNCHSENDDHTLKNIGEFAVEGAEAECQARGATLPLPTSSAQNKDLQELVNTKYNWWLMLIGVSDSGSRFLSFRAPLRRFGGH